jgi:hypothetical protein
MAVAEVVITSEWTPPPTIVGFSGTAQEPESFIQLDWSASTIDPLTFVNYRIYRREQGGSGDWSTLVDITNQSIVTYNDITVGQTIVYEYAITQFKTVTGDTNLESDLSEIVTAALQSDTWFIIANLSGEYNSIEIIAIDESHIAVLQQEVFEPLASNRKRVVRGQSLGNEGSITGVFDVSIARASKEYFETLNANGGPHILKSPFGDVWFVEFDAPAYKYQNGGHLQVTIGWVEVE